MSEARQSLGKRGENFVTYRLLQAGHTILARNWRHHELGEIDIVARCGREIVFVEVRTRRGPAQTALNEALASVDARKQDRLIRLAQAFLAAHDLHDRLWRIDVAAVGYQDGAFSMEVIRDAVQW